jgi:hypothetical protein
MAKPQKRNRELRELEKAARESIYRSYELIRKSEKLLVQSRDLLRVYASHHPSPVGIREPKE